MQKLNNGLEEPRFHLIALRRSRNVADHHFDSCRRRPQIDGGLRRKGAETVLVRDSLPLLRGHFCVVFRFGLNALTNKIGHLIGIFPSSAEGRESRVGSQALFVIKSVPNDLGKLVTDH